MVRTPKKFPGHLDEQMPHLIDSGGVPRVKFMRAVQDPKWVRNHLEATVNKLEGVHRAELRDRLLSPRNTDN